MYYYSNTKIKVNKCTNVVLGCLKKKRKKKEKMENFVLANSRMSM